MSSPWDNDPEVAPAPWANDPEVAAPAVFTRPPSEIPPGSKRTPQDEMTDASTVGRVLDAFGQGAKTGWGAEPLGLSPESEKWLRDNKIFDDFQGGFFSTAKAINEAWMRPTAAVLDGVLRSVRAGLYSVAGGVGEAAAAVGLAETPGRATRDLVALGETILTVGGAAPFGLKPSVRAPRVAVPAEIADNARPVTQEIPPPASDMVRMYHGGEDYAGGPRWFSSDLAYAEGYAKKDGRTTAQVYYVDVPETHPIFVADYADQTVRHGFTVNAELPEEFASQMRPVRAQATAEGIPEPVRVASEPAPLPVEVPGTATVDKAGNINLNRIAGGDDIKQIIRDTAESPNFNPKTRGPVTWAEIDDLAAETGLDANKLAKRAVGEAWNAEHIHAARQLFVQATDDVRALAAKIKNGDNSDATLMKYAEAELKQVAAQEQVAGLADEAGRALGIFRRMAGQKAEGDAIADTIRDALGGKKTLEDRARRIADLDDPAAASRVMREARDVTWKDRFLEVWYNVGLLSNPATHIANVASNTAVALYETMLAQTAGAVGTARRAVTGGVDGARMGDGLASLHGAIMGAREGVPAAWQAFKTERPSGTWAAGHDKPQMRALPSTESGWGGKQVRLAGRALMAEDELFRAIGSRQTLHELAHRAAREEGLSGGAYWQRYSEILANPTPDMLTEAAKQGTKAVFQTPLGKIGGSVQTIANESLAARLIVPFIRTPTNIIKYAGENSPLGLLSKEVRDNLRGANGAAKQDEQVARLFLGSMVSTALVSYAADGTITGGGPTDPGERAIWMLQHKPYHVRIGGYEYDYKRLGGPLGILLGVTADAKDVAKHATQGEADKIATLVGASIVKNLVQQTWMQGPADIIKAISDPDRYGEKWAQRMAASFLTPAVSAQVARIEDPYLKDARSIIDAIKARTPGLSGEVAPQRDIFGQMIPADLPLVHAARQAEDPVVQSFLRLGLFPSRPDRKMGGVELSPEQYDRLQYWTGAAMRTMTDVVVKTPGFTQMPEFAQKEMLSRAVDAARKMGRAKTQMGDPDLLRAMMQEQQKRFAK